MTATPAGPLATASGVCRLVEQLRPSPFYEGGTMSALQDLDRAGRRRSPAAMPGYHSGRAPANKGRRYPADPPRVEEIIAVMREAGETSTAIACAG